MRTEGGFRLYSEAVCPHLQAHPRPPALRLHARGDQGHLGRRPDPARHPGRPRLLSQGRGGSQARRPCSRRSRRSSTRWTSSRRAIERWEDLLKKKKKDIQGLKARNQKRGNGGQRRTTMPKIVFIEPQAPNLHIFSEFPLPRLGVLILGTMMAKRGWEVEVFVEDLRRVDYDVVAEGRPGRHLDDHLDGAPGLRHRRQGPRPWGSPSSWAGRTSPSWPRRPWSTPISSSGARARRP